MRVFMKCSPKIWMNLSHLSLLFYGSILMLGFELAQAENHIVSKNMVNFERCLQIADRARLIKRQQESRKVNAQVRQLCTSEQRNKAQNLAIGLALKLHKSKNVSRYRYCSKHFEDTQARGFNLLLQYHVSKLRFTHICDVEQQLQVNL